MEPHNTAYSNIILQRKQCALLVALTVLDSHLPFCNSVVNQHMLNLLPPTTKFAMVQGFLSTLPVTMPLPFHGRTMELPMPPKRQQRLPSTRLLLLMQGHGFVP